MKTLIITILVAASVSSFCQSTVHAPVIVSPKDVVQEMLTAYQAHNREKFMSFVHPDIVWIQPGDNQLSGVKKSKDELMQMGALMGKITGKTIRLADVKYFDVTGNTVACLLHWKAAQPDGKELDILNIDVYTVEDSKVIQAKIFTENAAIEDQFWGKL